MNFTWKLAIGLVVGITGVCLAIGSLASTTRYEFRTDRSALSSVQVAPAGTPNSARIATLGHAEAELALQNLGYIESADDVSLYQAYLRADPSKPVPSPESVQKLIWTAQVNLEVDDPSAAGSAVKTMAAELGGYVSGLQESTDSEGSAYLSMTVRVPVAQLHTGMDKLQTLGKLLSRNLNSQDVSLQYVDTESRLKNLRNTQERLLAHLSKAAELPAIIAVEQELSRVLEQIERLQGQLNALSNQVEFATITLLMNSSRQAGPLAPGESLNSAKVFADALRALIEFGRTFWVGTIWVAVWSPVWSVFVLAGYLVIRAKSRRAELAPGPAGRCAETAKEGMT